MQIPAERPWLPELVPAAMLGAAVSLVLGAAQLLPTGEAMLLVRAPTAEAALAAADRADAALVGIPAPGFAIVHGDAARIRGALGLAVNWNASARCAPDSEAAR